MARPKPVKKLNYYGLTELGYAQSIPVSGDYNADQLQIEKRRVDLRSVHLGAALLC